MIIKEISEERIDVLSKYTLKRIAEIHQDPTIDGSLKSSMENKLRELSTIFGASALMLTNSYGEDGAYISHTVGVFDEEDEPNGVYVYISTTENIADKDLPPNKRYDNAYTLFASTNPDDLHIMIYYGEDPICRVSFCDKLPEVITLDTENKEISDRVRGIVLTAISMIKAALMDAYIRGYNYGKESEENEK